MLLEEYRHTLAAPCGTAGGAAVTVRRLGLQDYEPIWQAMRYIAEHPGPTRGDEIWVLSHKPVYTLGQAGKAHHILNAGRIPVLKVDRGGQVTYHGPGQLVVYLLLDLRKRHLGARRLVDLIEAALLETLDSYGIRGQLRKGAPGIYVEDAKIAALGLRIRKGRSYHGLSLNVNMDLSPFQGINPCGYQGLAVTQMAALLPDTDQLMQRVSKRLVNALLRQLHCQPLDENG